VALIRESRFHTAFNTTNCGIPLDKAQYVAKIPNAAQADLTPGSAVKYH
jgi:hypothetical protein